MIKKGGLKTLRIAHIDTEKTWRGGQQQAFSLIKGLKKKGHHNLAVVRKDSPFAEKMKSNDISTLELNPFGEWDFISAHILNRVLKEQRIDLIHAHAPHAAGLGAFASLGTNIPLLISRRVDFHLKKNIFSKWKHKRAKFLVAVSDGVKQILISDGIPENKIAVVKSGVDFSRFENVGKATANEMTIPEGSIVIGQVAALADHKDQKTFIEAMNLLKKRNNHVVGVIVGEGALREELEALTQSLGAQDTVRFLGFQKEPLKFLSAFDIFCLSSKEEGLGTSVLDAMAMNVIVVATKAGGIPEMIQDGITGYLSEPRNPEALAEALERAIEGRGGKNKAICEQARLKAKEFDVVHTVDKTEKLYHSILND